MKHVDSYLILEGKVHELYFIMTFLTQKTYKHLVNHEYDYENITNSMSRTFLDKLARSNA